MGQKTESQFVDLCVDKNGIVHALDVSKGRIFQYDTEGRLISVYGGTGTQLGSFSKAQAIAEMNGKIYVLDQDSNGFTVFSSTEYGKMLINAICLHNDGKYSEAKSLWNEILSQNANSEIACVGLGKALLEEENYTEAMKYFKLGYDREGYSDAFKMHRAGLMKANFGAVMTGLVILAILITVLVYIKKFRTKKGTYKKRIVMPAKLSSALRVLVHPIDEYEELKFKKNWSVGISLSIIIAWFVATVLSKTATGFIFNHNAPDSVNIIYEFAATALLFVLFVTCNWAVTTLLNGKGKWKEIFFACSYALIPYLTAIIINIGLSNVITQEESAFYMLVQAIGILYTAFLLFDAMRVIHEYSISKTIVCVILTVLAMAFVIFLLFLFFALAQQLFSFIASIYNEIMYR
jgi:tetratricopeptide (TPR) repeat protein